MGNAPDMAVRHGGVARERIAVTAAPRHFMAIACFALSAPMLGACATTDVDGAGNGRMLAAGQFSTVAASGVGSATVEALDTATIRLTISVQGMNPGTFGTHIHSVGRCDPPDFMSAGPHWNPAARQHGRHNPLGSHAGDLPNIEIGANGSGRLVLDMAAEHVDSLFDTDGSSVIIHATQDDEVSDPTGNSGARVACAVLMRVTATPPRD